MRTRLLNIIALIFFLLGPTIAWPQSLDSAAVTGTYRAHVKFRGKPITNDVRILYLSDSSFAFTMTGDASNGTLKYDSVLLQFNNYNTLRGIARKVIFHGKLTWIGVIEDYQISYKDTGFFNPDLVITDLNILLDTTFGQSVVAKKYDRYNSYDLLQFNFPNPGRSLDINLLLTHWFLSADLYQHSMDGAYQKINTLPISFPHHSYYVPGNLTGVIKYRTQIKRLPVPESVSANKTVGLLSPGTVIYLNSSYQKYVLCTQYDKDFHILHQGWISMDAIKNISLTSLPPTLQFLR